MGVRAGAARSPSSIAGEVRSAPTTRGGSGARDVRLPASAELAARSHAPGAPGVQSGQLSAVARALLVVLAGHLAATLVRERLVPARRHGQLPGVQPVLRDPDPARFGFFSIIYSLAPDPKFHWRWNEAKLTCERNDRMLRRAGYPGLTVFATNESMRGDWAVHKLVILPKVLDACPADIPLCPKINFFKQPELWTEVASEALFFLDADAEIKSLAFVRGAGHYLDLPVDYAAAPDVGRWHDIGMQEEGPYNTGAYFMRMRAFRNPDFERMLDFGIARNNRASPSAPDPPPPEKKPVPQGEQSAFNSYLRDTESGRKVRVQNLPWQMHCRTWYVTRDCWLVHWWYSKNLDTLPRDFGEAQAMWRELTGGVSNRTSNSV